MLLSRSLFSLLRKLSVEATILTLSTSPEKLLAIALQKVLDS